MGRKNWGAMGCAALLGAAVAFPAGLIIGWHDPPVEKAQRGTAGMIGNYRKIYSPDAHNDPYVQAQWQRVVEELEAQCSYTGERCTEAKAARESLNAKW